MNERTNVVAKTAAITATAALQGPPYHFRFTEAAVHLGLVPIPVHIEKKSKKGKYNLTYNEDDIAISENREPENITLGLRRMEVRRMEGNRMNQSPACMQLFYITFSKVSLVDIVLGCKGPNQKSGKIGVTSTRWIFPSSV
jgi:hypothetical protein